MVQVIEPEHKGRERGGAKSKMFENTCGVQRLDHRRSNILRKRCSNK